MTKRVNAIGSKEDFLPLIQNQNSDQSCIETSRNDYQVDTRNNSSMLIKNLDTDGENNKELTQSKHKSFDQSKTFENYKTSSKSINNSLNYDANYIKNKMKARPQGPKEGVDMFNALMEQ